MSFVELVWLKKQHLWVLLYLRLIADEDVILHGVRNVVHRELQEGPLWHTNQANTSPGGSTVLRVGTWNNCHSLKR